MQGHARRVEQNKRRQSGTMGSEALETGQRPKDQGPTTKDQGPSDKTKKRPSSQHLVSVGVVYD